uniref:Uncharacterized protein n=1 Tax=Mammaliicoccus phage MSShimriz1 TaxID=3230127 RepID=A0AAU8GVF6_9VIRU
MRKNLIVTILSCIMLFLSIFLYMYITTQYETKPRNIQINTNEKGKITNDNVEFVTSVTLKRVKDNKACFMEPLPDYMPGRTSASCIDMSYYKSSQFREGVNFKVLRVYTKEPNGDIVHTYMFSRELDKEKPVEE